jgi:hypothetical protein
MRISLAFAFHFFRFRPLQASMNIHVSLLHGNIFYLFILAA